MQSGTSQAPGGLPPYSPGECIARFRVEGEPVPEPRPRAYVAPSGRASVYKTKRAKDWARTVLVSARHARPPVPIAGPVTVVAVFHFRRPLRLSRKSDPPGLIPHVCKPDLDNLLKPVLDALTRDRWWRDDSQVVRVLASKYYGRVGDGAGVEVMVLTDPPPLPRA